jgi:hypothetical protein
MTSYGVYSVQCYEDPDPGLGFFLTKFLKNFIFQNALRYIFLPRPSLRTKQYKSPKHFYFYGAMLASRFRITALGV